MNKQVTIDVYGSDVPCSSCLHSPSSKDTFEWIQAALSRKFPNQPFIINYIDIEKATSKDDLILKQIIEGKVFYPAVVINGELVAEGDPRLKTIYEAMEKQGYTAE
ncbi:YuzD family protein [Bacillus sp. Marseille-P3661]|uniref:YuzD family protein n=1 Tax=Bacillus sp. Marseille-P3661 TaxID=1936234 RepID=UPI000C867B4B|nr:DUF1462 family protein [Bacillus sp. Marseille-P3661]